AATASAAHHTPDTLLPAARSCFPMSQTRFCQGDRVIVAPEAARPANRGVVYRVTRILKVNVVVEPVDGGRPVRIHPDYLLPAPDDTTTAASVAGTASVAVPY